MSPQQEIVVLDHDPNWSVVFEGLRSKIWPAISDLATTIEHVGSTSVDGLSAKAVIVIPEQSRMSALIDALAAIYYHHRGDLGIPGRECFESAVTTPEQHLNGCVERDPLMANRLLTKASLENRPV